MYIYVCWCGRVLLINTKCYTRALVPEIQQKPTTTATDDDDEEKCFGEGWNKSGQKDEYRKQHIHMHWQFEWETKMLLMMFVLLLLLLLMFLPVSCKVICCNRHIPSDIHTFTGFRAREIKFREMLGIGEKTRSSITHFRWSRKKWRSSQHDVHDFTIDTEPRHQKNHIEACSCTNLFTVHWLAINQCNGF